MRDLADTVERGVSEPPADGGLPPTARRQELYDDGMMGVGLLAARANIIMQLARPGVGYGVMESRVESGRVDLHPIKRLRTTLTYLAVAAWGDEAQRTAFRRAVDKQHAQVRSTAESPVEYSAFDRDLQLWVAACLYKGTVDVVRLFVGEMDDDTSDALYEGAVTLGTTLQMTAGQWPADRKEFDRYWQESLDLVRIDPPVRAYLHTLADGSMTRSRRWPAWLRARLERRALTVTTGFLPQKFRDEMQLDWTPRMERDFARLITIARTVHQALPRVLRRFPFNYLMHDLDRRIRTGRPLA